MLVKIELFTYRARSGASVAVIDERVMNRHSATKPIKPNIRSKECKKRDSITAEEREGRRTYGVDGR